MTLGYCIPNHNRTPDLAKCIRPVIRAANESPPVEIVILDYGSSDGCLELCDRMAGKVKAPSSMVYKRHEAENYHNAHARNLSCLASSGDYLFIASTEASPSKDFFHQLRRAVEGNPDFVYPVENSKVGHCLIKKDFFISIGGFDERFEYYGKEDKDIIERAKRGSSRIARYSAGDIGLSYTPKNKKASNYRGGLSLKEMGRRMKKIYNENNENGVIVANLGKEWGADSPAS